MNTERLVAGLLISVLFAWFITTLLILVDFVRTARQNPDRLLGQVFGVLLKGKTVYFHPNGWVFIVETSNEVEASVFTAYSDELKRCERSEPPSTRCARCHQIVDAGQTTDEVRRGPLRFCGTFCARAHDIAESQKKKESADPPVSGPE